MFNPFPELLDFAFFAPFFLRMALGSALFLTSFHQLIDQKYQTAQRFVTIWPKHGVQLLWISSVAEIIIGLSLIAGFYTQYAAIAGALLALVAACSRKYQQATKRNILYYMLVLSICLSLLITGAGVFAYDLPL